MDALTGPIGFEETGPDFAGWHEFGPETYPVDVGDVVVSRRFGSVAYHLSVVIDDHLQGITEVVRGVDLFDATQIHVLLQRLLGLPTPVYHHHPLIRDEHGKRLAKRDDARAIATYRAEGASPEDVRRLVGL
jgi:glutamyl-Q tRNA(Asp) synthetase